MVGSKKRSRKLRVIDEHADVQSKWAVTDCRWSECRKKSSLDRSDDFRGVLCQGIDTDKGIDHAGRLKLSR